MKSILKILSIFILITTVQSCQDEPVGSTINAEDIIEVDSELYNLLDRVADIENTENELTCIEFLYPVALYVFNEDVQLLNSQQITTDQEFSDFLGSLDPNYSISISYPIATTLNDGSVFTINTNEELKDVIDNCIEELEEEEEIYDCEQLIRNCVWKVGYIHNTDNTYLGAVFNEADGATSLIYDNSVYFGSWNALFIEGELHINISLNTQSEVGTDMNFDWKVQYLNGSSIKLTNGDKTMVLHQYCDTDYALCSTFDFEACEMESVPGYAEITTEDYTYCIKNILRIDEEETFTIGYFETYEDANTQLNEIPQDQPYVNSTPNVQYLYVRITNTEDNSFFIIQLTITIVNC